MKTPLTLVQLQEKLAELQKQHADLVNGPDPDSNVEAIGKLAADIEQLELEVLEAEEAAAKEEAAAESKAGFKVSDDLQKNKGKELKALEGYFKRAAAKFPGEACVIHDFALNNEEKTVIVVLNAEKKGMRKVVLNAKK